jgi:hypothetical protein
MSDLWEGLGAAIQQGNRDGQWLYRTGADTHGPVPLRAIVDRWLAGTLDAQTPVARQGTEFAPLGQVAAFAPYRQAAEDAAAQRQRATGRRRTALVVVALTVAAAVAGFVVQQEYLRRVAEQQAEQKQLAQAAAAEELVRAQAQAEAERQANLAHASAHAMKLVALVSLGSLQEVKIARPPPQVHHRRRGMEHRGRRLGGDDSASTSDSVPIDDNLVEACQLTEQDIFSTLRSELAKLNVCVEDEKQRDDAKLLPKSLELQFIVRPDGKVIEFAVNDRHFRSGPLNNCLVKAFKTIHFPAKPGANCPVTIPIKIGA